MGCWMISIWTEKTKIKEREHRALGKPPSTNRVPYITGHTLSDRIWTTHNISVHFFLGDTYVQLVGTRGARGIAVLRPAASGITQSWTSQCARAVVVWLTNSVLFWWSETSKNCYEPIEWKEWTPQPEAGASVWQYPFVAVAPGMSVLKSNDEMLWQWTYSTTRIPLPTVRNGLELHSKAKKRKKASGRRFSVFGATTTQLLDMVHQELQSG